MTGSKVTLRTLCACMATAVCLLGGHSAAASSPAKRTAGHQTMSCAYTSLSETALAGFDALARKRTSCAVVFANTMTSWADWEWPWFLNHQRDADWSAWASAPGQGRRLVITMSMLPPRLAGRNWRRAGARGRFDGHARALARNLVAAGLGSSIIRLGAEMNGDWNADNVGRTPRDFRLWTRTWRHEVRAMRSVPGARFQFDWNVNAAVRPIPLASIYPGNDVVDIVGIDAYDQGVAATRNRWREIYDRPLGIRDVLRFAKAHHKPLSIPEWGIAPRSVGSGGGNDPSYIRGIASVVRHYRVAYEAYFYKGPFAAELDASPASLRAYRRYFGGTR